MPTHSATFERLVLDEFNRLSKGQKVLVVTNNPQRNFPDHLSCERIIFWDNRELVHKQAIPKGVVLVVKSIFISHKVVEQLCSLQNSQSAKIDRHAFPVGELKTLLNYLISGPRPVPKPQTPARPKKIVPVFLALPKKEPDYSVPAEISSATVIVEPEPEPVVCEAFGHGEPAIPKESPLALSKEFGGMLVEVHTALGLLTEALAKIVKVTS